MQTLSLSVRHLAEFAYPAPDISRTGDVRALRDGTLGHRARQAALGEGWQAEVALKEELFVPDLDLCLLLSGRMDAFRDDEDLPTVEEIKLSSAPLPPFAPL